MDTILTGTGRAPGILYGGDRRETSLERSLREVSQGVRIRKAGKVTEGLWCLGREESCVYLLEGGDDAMLISGGMAYLVPTLLEQFSLFGIDPARISRVLILHAHFDHVGIVPYFKRRNPRIQLLASARAWEILQMPKAISTINEFSRDGARRMGLEEVYGQYDLDWGPDIQGETVRDGDRIWVGAFEGRVLETPGHSSCSISLYVPELEALFPSDGGGIPYKEGILASGNSDFTQYQGSLHRLLDLPVRFLCADHYGYVTGEEARGYIQRSIEEAARQRATMEAVYLKTGEIDTAAKRLMEEFYKANPDYIIPPPIYEGVYRQMLRHLARHLPSASP